MDTEKLAARKAEMQAELQKVISQINQVQQQAAEMQALAQRITGAIAMLDELMSADNENQTIQKDTK